MSRLKPPRLGSLDWIPLYRGAEEREVNGKQLTVPLDRGITVLQELEGIEVAIAYVGSDFADEYNAKRAQLELEEAQRLCKLRQGLDPEAAKAIRNTGENERAMTKLVNEALAVICPEVRDGAEQLSGEEAQAFLRTLPNIDRFRLVLLGMTAQGVSRRQIFPSAGAGGDQAGDVPGRGG